jgi:hypothetical protein
MGILLKDPVPVLATVPLQVVLVITGHTREALKPKDQWEHIAQSGIKIWRKSRMELIKIIAGFLLVLSFSFSSVAYGAGCQIKYGWNKGNSLQGTFENKSKTITLNKGQTKTINKKRMNYVKNLKNRQVKFYLKSATDVTLGKNQRNPVAGTYVGTVKLKKVKCIGSSSSSSSNTGSFPGSSSSSNSSTSSGVSTECSPVDVAKTPAPPAPYVPIPYPNLSNQNKKNCKP